MASHAALDRWQETHGAASAARWEFEQVIEETLKHIKPLVVVEIGAHAGASLAVWIEEFKPIRAIAVEMECSERTLSGLMPLGALLVFGDSTDPDVWGIVRGNLHGNPIDFLYIDGDHSGIMPAKDFALYGSLVRPGGVVVLDDTKREEGVQKVVQAVPGGFSYEAPGDSTGKYLVVKPSPSDEG